MIEQGGSGLDPLPCIVCDVVPETAAPRRNEAEPAQPYGATMFAAYGQYGSTAFDPQDGSQLRINVCDKCLLAKVGHVWHDRHIRQPELTVFSQPWSPNREAA